MVMAASSDKDDAKTREPSSLDDFSDRLDAMRGARDEKEKESGSGSAWGRAMQTSSALLSAIFVGGLLGFGLDRWLDTGPWLLLVGIALGFAAGLRNLSRFMK